MNPLKRLSMLVLVLLIGCSGEPDSPEAQIRALIHEAHEAAEERDRGALMAMLHDAYEDPDGYTRKEIEGLLRLHFLRNKNVHLWLRIEDVVLSGESTAVAYVLVAMAGEAAAEDAIPVSATLHHFNLEFAHDGEAWKVIRAAWRRAQRGDLLPE